MIPLSKTWLAASLLTLAAVQPTSAQSFPGPHHGESACCSRGHLGHRGSHAHSFGRLKWKIHNFFTVKAPYRTCYSPGYYYPWQKALSCIGAGVHSLKHKVCPHCQYTSAPPTPGRAWAYDGISGQPYMQPAQWAILPSHIPPAVARELLPLEPNSGATTVGYHQLLH